MPLFPASPLLGIAFCGYLIYGTGLATWLQFAGFLVVGALVYACYGRRRSRLVQSPDVVRSPDGGDPAGAVATAPAMAAREG